MLTVNIICRRIESLISDLRAKKSAAETAAETAKRAGLSATATLSGNDATDAADAAALLAIQEKVRCNCCLLSKYTHTH